VELNRLARAWDRLGRDDPHWAVLYDPEKRGNRWDEQDFYATGEREIAEVMDYLQHLGLAEERGRAIDFGCGVGRLTLPRALHFAHVDGVDIAGSMVERARRANPHGDRCAFHVNERPDLALFDDATFDLVHSRLVLQHMEPDLARGYIREFLRIARPGGTVLFDLPSGRASSLTARLATWLPLGLVNAVRRVRYRSPAVMELHFIPPEEVLTSLRAWGGDVVDAGPIPAAPGSLITKFRYCVRRGP
jgi:SAM-dependent methyltransferase